MRGDFVHNCEDIDAKLTAEIENEKSVALLDHLHLCGTIPEHYGHDSSEEKLYSKYSDSLLAAAFRYIGLKSRVLSERGDAADVIACRTGRANDSLIGDAKVFRLSRTAKNQKDFKIEAMHGWKGVNRHAIVVCPIHQLPARSSQIYQQAIGRKVCIFSYSHIAVLIRMADVAGKPKAADLLFTVLNCTEALNPTKDANEYWTCINRAMRNGHEAISHLWEIEKAATLESIALAKKEALAFIEHEQRQILKMSREQAIQHLIRNRNIEGRQKIVQGTGHNNILTFG